ncbi:glyoxal oxidase N-terminus-domain-containing protein [Hysterangium stoloniferum]|nr:glyoxal oxidase N-terminus-domain-containing protein [Hysterangium stoloniferum]
MHSLVGALCVAISFFAAFSLAQTPGSFVVVGETQASAMMMFVGNEEKVYILDKVEGNPTQIGNPAHPVWAVEWDIASSTATPMDMSTNSFCAAGMHFPNGSYAVYGGNSAVTTGGNTPSVVVNGENFFDATYQDFDGSRGIRIIDPCTDGKCTWFDNSSLIAMNKKRWYPGIESLPDGSVVLIGGFVNGGYINKNTLNSDPLTSGGAAEPTFEFYPPQGGDPQVMDFMGKTSGLNAYAHTFLMPSGKIFVQANLSTMLWDYTKNQESDLPDMPNNVVRVYPASGGAAMLPLTPANNYTPTILFCGGSDMPAEGYGNYSNPLYDTFSIPASKDCQRITPEPTDGSQVLYVQDEDMLEGRTMGQFIMLPDGTLLMINGAQNGTAGYATNTGMTPQALMPFTMSLASDPAFTPAIYNPNNPKGQRWSNAGLQSSTIPRLYHSSALLLPDASVLVAGSNPNIDYNPRAVFPTEYRAERFYPPYFKATVRPKPTGIPGTLTYGGSPFDVTIPSTSYSGAGNDAATNTTFVIIRPGWTTHGMNMGQRFMQLNNTFTVADDGTITLHVSQLPPTPNLITPGPVFAYVVVHGIPSNGTMVIVGNGQISAQSVFDASVLPPSVLSAKATGSADPSTTTNGSGSGGTKKPGSGISTGVIVAAAVGSVALIAIAAVFASTIMGGIHRSTSMGRGYRDAKPLEDPAPGFNDYNRESTGSGDAFIPLQQYSQADLHAPSGHVSSPSMANSNLPAGAQLASYSDYEQMNASQEFNPYEQQQPAGRGQGYGQGYRQDQGHPRYV